MNATKKDTLAKISNNPLSAILPARVDKSKYNETDLEVIERGVQSPISAIEDPQVARTGLIASLMEVAIAYGFTVDKEAPEDQIAFKECASVILEQYDNIALEQVRHAFRIAHKTGADLEAYGKRFNAGYLKRVLDAYTRYVNEVLPAIKDKEARAAKRAEAAARYEREQAEAAAKREAAKRTWPLTQCRLIVRDYARFLAFGECRWHEASSTLIVLVKEIGLLDGLFNEDDREGMMIEATKNVKSNFQRTASASRSVERRSAIQRAAEVDRGILNPDTKAAIIAEYCKLGLQQFFVTYALDWDVRDMANALFAAMKAAGKATLSEFKEHVRVDEIEAEIEAEKQRIEAENNKKKAVQQLFINKPQGATKKDT